MGIHTRMPTQSCPHNRAHTIVSTQSCPHNRVHAITQTCPRNHTSVPTRSDTTVTSSRNSKPFWLRMIFDTVLPIVFRWSKIWPFLSPACDHVTITQACEYCFIVHKQTDNIMVLLLNSSYTNYDQTNVSWMRTPRCEFG